MRRALQTAFLGAAVGTTLFASAARADWFDFEHHAWFSPGVLATTDDSGGIGAEASLTWWPLGMGTGSYGVYAQNVDQGGWGVGAWAQAEYLLDFQGRGRYGLGGELLFAYWGCEIGGAIVDPTAGFGRTLFLQVAPFFSFFGVIDIGARISVPMVSLDSGATPQPIEIGALFTVKLPLALDKGKPMPPSLTGDFSPF